MHPSNGPGPATSSTSRPTTSTSFASNVSPPEGRTSLARGEATVAAATLDPALTLCHGPALAEFVDRPFAIGHARRIERMVQAVEEDLVDARLALGQHDQLLTRIERLVEADPLSERRWGQLMTALYRCGRQADALDAYQRARRTLIEALGLEPGPELRRIESDILGQSLSDAAPLPRGRRDLPAHRCRRLGSHVGARTRGHGSRHRTP